MPVTLTEQVYRVFGVDHAGLTARSNFRLQRMQIASLLVSAFLIVENLYHQKSFNEYVRRASEFQGLVAAIDRAIEDVSAYDSETGNLKPHRMKDLAQRLEEIDYLSWIFTPGKGIIFASFVEDAYQSTRLAQMVGKSPLETLHALLEFEYNINEKKNCSLNRETFHYMMAITRRCSYSYAYHPQTRCFIVADQSVSQFVMTHGLQEKSGWFGGRLHVVGERVVVDGGGGNDFQGNPFETVQYLRAEYGTEGFLFEALGARPNGAAFPVTITRAKRPERENPIETFLLERDSVGQLANYDALAIGDVVVFVTLPASGEKQFAFLNRILGLIGLHGTIPLIFLPEEEHSLIGTGVLVSKAADNSSANFITIGSPEIEMGDAKNPDAFAAQSQSTRISRPEVSCGNVFLARQPVQEGAFTLRIFQKIRIRSAAFKEGLPALRRYFLPELPDWLQGTVIYYGFGSYQVVFTVPVNNKSDFFQGHAMPINGALIGRLFSSGDLVSIT